MVYGTIVRAIRSHRLKEPFSKQELRRACPRLKESTCCTFPWKHRKGNPGGAPELFIKVGPNKFKLIRPFRYGL